MPDEVGPSSPLPAPCAAKVRIKWSSGVAAGAAAALLGAHACPGGRAGRGGSACGVVGFNSTRQLATGEGLAALLRLLGSTGIQQPLDWGV